ncbi:MAG: transcriptional regulator [Phenylobacterium zucineum]|nr:MAG: transcriptional regulator [Phenylobacterium zucineum]
MIADILSALLRSNVAMGAAVLAVVLARGPARRAFGPVAAYGLWAMVPLAGLAALLPRPVDAVEMTATVLAAAAEAARRSSARPDVVPDAALLALWLAGAAVAATVLLARQVRFLRALGRLELGADGALRAERAGVGPAVVGALRPRIVTPADFEARFAPDERAVILIHEATHLARGDAAINAVAAGLTCLCWFNPLIHLAARWLRVDQELACDATVLAQRPAARRLYAETLLKTQLATQALPLGCHWPAGGEHPLKARIAMLKAPAPSRRRRLAGLALAGAASLGAACVAWAGQPAATPPLITLPDWTSRPSGEDIRAAAAAESARVDGMATIACRVARDGTLADCEVARASSPEIGRVALALGGRFRMNPTTRDGQSTQDGVVRIPIRFVTPK